MAAGVSKGHHGTAGPERQSTYGEYHLPAGLRLAATVPLYQAVAVWGWRLRRPFCREELAKAFHLELRRAGDVMSYIRRARPDRIASRQFYSRASSGGRLRYLHIIAKPRIEGLPVSETPVHLTPQAPPDGADTAPLPALRRWFIGGARGNLP